MGRLEKIVDKPYTKTLKWKNEKFDKKTKTTLRETGWYYYNKFETEAEDGRKGEDVKVPMPFTFVWLESATSFTGFNKESEKSIYSNEVLSERTLKSLFPKKKEESLMDYNKRIASYMTLRVKMDGEDIGSGLYKSVKESVADKGAKYCQPVYALMQTEDGETEIVRILMSGASATEWITFAKDSKLRSHAICCNGAVPKESGSVEYEAPVFKYVTATPELNERADDAAGEVRKYFKYIIEEAVENEELETEVESEVEFT